MWIMLGKLLDVRQFFFVNCFQLVKYAFYDDMTNVLIISVYIIFVSY